MLRYGEASPGLRPRAPGRGAPIGGLLSYEIERSKLRKEGYIGDYIGEFCRGTKGVY